MSQLNLNNYIDFDRNTPDFIRFIVEFLVDTGMRPSELWLVCKSNLNYIDGVLDYKQPKTQIRRIVKLSADVLRQSRWFRRHMGNFAGVFRSTANLRRSVLQFCHPLVQVEDGHKKLYYFRYLYVLNCLKAGKLPDQIARLLGHSDFTTVYDYIKKAEFIEKELSLKGGKDG